MSELARVRPTVRMTDEEIWEFVANGHTGILTTLRGDGVPMALPVWYAAVDRVIYVGTRGKKLTRVAKDSRASFLVESGQRWVELRAVHFTCRAEILDDVSEQLGRQIEAEMERKYAFYRADRSSMPPEASAAYDAVTRRVIRLTPDDRVLNWDNRKLGIR